MQVAITNISLGKVLVAASSKGVVAIFLGEDASALKREFTQHFPDATIKPSSKAFEKLVTTVIQNIENPGRHSDIPLDIQGTDFQKTVWNALCEIPPGTTATYSDIANKIGKPNATRAVGTACGKNHISILIPCHRVIGSNGALTGYRWGVERKRELLAREQQRTKAAA